jgi:hypothetical protein
LMNMQKRRNEMVARLQLSQNKGLKNDATS